MESTVKGAQVRRQGGSQCDNQTRPSSLEGEGLWEAEKGQSRSLVLSSREVGVRLEWAARGFALSGKC